MTLGEKACYLKGLIDGLELDKQKAESKAVYAIIDFLEKVAQNVENLEDAVDNVSDEIAGLREDVDDIVNEDSLDEYSSSYDSESTDDSFYELTCPECNTKICLSEDALADESATCPKCGNEIEIDVNGISSSDEACGCCSDCNHCSE